MTLFQSSQNILNPDTQVKLTKRMKYLKTLSDKFWCRWKLEYLTHWTISTTSSRRGYGSRIQSSVKAKSMETWKGDGIN